MSTKNEKGHNYGNRRSSYSLHPLSQGPQVSSSRVFPIRAASKSCLSEFTQRIMSGKLLQLKQYQNQLTEAQNHLLIAKEENKALTRLLKRHEISLRRYEGENAGMPRLLRAHGEEVRILRMTVHQLRSELKEVQSLLRGKEAEVLTLKDTLTQLKKLCDEKKLFDQEKADKKIEQLEQLKEEQSREIQLLSRRILLETKNHQRLIKAEEMKHRETRKTLDEALAQISKMEREKRSSLFASSKRNSPSFHTCCNQVFFAQVSQDGGDISSKLENIPIIHIERKKTARQTMRNGAVISLPNFRPNMRQTSPSI